MKFATNKEHRDFFQKQGWIEFEGLLSDEQLKLANQAIDQVLAERLEISPEKVYYSSSENKFLQGHDLWRSDEYLRKLTVQSRFAELVAELIEKRPLRLGYAQFFPTILEKEKSMVYAPFLEKNHSLESVSSMRGVVCGLMIALGEEDSIDPEKEEQCEGEIDIFPRQKGNVIVFLPNVGIHWNALKTQFNQRFYMIVYTAGLAQYQIMPEDPHAYALKRLGYIYHDQLNDRLNPIVYR